MEALSKTCKKRKDRKAVQGTKKPEQPVALQLWLQFSIRPKEGVMARSRGHRGFGERWPWIIHVTSWRKNRFISAVTVITTDTVGSENFPFSKNALDLLCLQPAF